MLNQLKYITYISRVCWALFLEYCYIMEMQLGYRGYRLKVANFENKFLNRS